LQGHCTDVMGRKPGKVLFLAESINMGGNDIDMIYVYFSVVFLIVLSSLLMLIEQSVYSTAFGSNLRLPGYCQIVGVKWSRS